MTEKQRYQSRGTYILSSAKEGEVPSYNIARKLAIKGDSLAVKHRGKIC